MRGVLWRVCGSAVLGLMLQASAARAQETSVPELTPDEQKAMAVIQQGMVTSTISFLSSDEMAGRDTPSKELNIAAAYVAARFRGAGLEGLGPEGSFYQTNELQQYGAPASNATVKAGSESIQVLGTVFGPDEAAEVRSVVVTDKEDVTGKLVVMDEPVLPPQAASNPLMGTVAIARRIAPIAAKKPSGILIRVAEGSPLPDMMAASQGKAVSMPAQFQYALPVVLIPKQTKLDGEVQLNATPRVRNVAQVHNVIGVLRGSDPELSKQAIMITAHLDHIGVLQGDREGDTINNGADDNATGCTAVVTLADAFAALETKPARSVIFMTFWGEEKGLLGSKYFADKPLWPLENVVANVNIEMIGRPEVGADEKMWGTGWTRSTLGPQLAVGAKRAGVEVFHREDVSEMLYARSDNYSFVQKGVIAHSFSAGSLHNDYHQPSDEFSKLNVKHMTRIIQGLFAGCLPLAKNQLTPTKTE
ncbi:MAG: M28 family peptidase [Planctomycetaceae bacterium]